MVAAHTAKTATAKTAADEKAEAAKPAAEKAEKAEKAESRGGVDTKALGESPAAEGGVSADVKAWRESHANLPVLEVLPTNDGEETQVEVLERLSRERKAQQLGSDLVPDSAPDAE